MKIIIDGLTIEGSEIDFETLRIKFQMIGRAFEELAKNHKSLCLTDISVEYLNKAIYVNEVLSGRDVNDK